MLKRYINYWKTFRNYKYLLSLFVKRDVKKKYRGSYLGILWSLVNPLFHMTVLTIVFSTLFTRTIENFPVYYLCGYLFFQFFSTTTTSSMKSIITSSHLITKVYLPKYIVTFSTVLSNFIFFIISLIPLILIMIVTKAEITVNILYAPIYFVLFFFFCCGTGLFLATITVFLRDIEHIYGIFITALLFASAIFYPADIIPDKYQFILTFNPVYQFISGFREVVYVGVPPDIINIIVCIAIAIASMVVGTYIFEKNQHKFILHL